MVCEDKSGVLMQKGNVGAGQVDRIVFLTPRPINAYEESKWAFSYLRSQDYAIEVIDLSGILNKGRDLRELVDEPLQGDFIHHVSSYSDFEELVKRFAVDSIFIDYLVAHSNVSLKVERIFRILKRQGAKYAFLSSGALPIPTLSTGQVSGKLSNLKAKLLKAIFDPGLLFNYFASKVIVFLTRFRVLYPLPVVIFGGDSEVLKRFIEARGINKSEVVLINSFDFDNSVRFCRSLGGKLPAEEDICVFLDEALTHHSDFAVLSMEPADSDVYFTSMNRYFDFVEKSTGLRVIIAAHPRSHYESMSDVFGGREIIKGKTVELVAKCKLVVMHMSTSLSYAVLYKKPVIPVKIPGMPLSCQMNKMVDVFALAIGTSSVDISKDELSPSSLVCGYDAAKYDEYRDHYVKTVGAEELPEWEIVAKTLKNLNLATQTGSSPCSR